MFRNYMPVLTCLVFALGLGIGMSWSRGLIPLTLAPAKTGSLSIEVSQREPLPLPNRSSSTNKQMVRSVTGENIPDDADDSIVFEQQTEPDPDSSIAVTRGADTRDYSQIIPAVREEETRLVAPDQAEPEHKPEPIPESSPPVRPLKRAAPRAVADTAINSRQERPRRVVNAVAHQDPAESSNDAAPPSDAASETVSEQLAAAEAKLAAGEVLQAHREFSKLYWNHKELRPQLQEKIDATARSIFFESQPHFIEPYVIQSGDRMEVVAKNYQLSWEYLARLNRTEPRRIQIGQKLKVLKGPFAAVVELHAFELIVHLQGYYVKRYHVCTGKDNSSPIGKFAVLNKVVNPPYTGPDGKVIAADDPSNPLGERWIDLGDSYGIHGTIDPDSIGKAESRGCIRLRDQDVIEVYNFLVKGSEVVIRK